MSCMGIIECVGDILLDRTHSPFSIESLDLQGKPFCVAAANAFLERFEGSIHIVHWS
jgi:hypothetical protein